MTPVLAWVRALSGGRRRVIGRRRGASMVLAPRPVARRSNRIGVIATHDHHHHRHLRYVTVAAAERVATSAGASTRLHGATAPDHGRVRRVAAGRQRVVTSGPRPAGAKPAMTAAPPSAPAVGLAVRRAVAAIGGAHRRVEGVVAPALSTAPLASGRRAGAPAGRPPAPARSPAAAHPLPLAAASRARPAMVLRPAAVAATAAAPVAEPLPARAATAATTPSARVLSELDVEAFTDRIVQQIDRRIVAHRERLGRI